MRWSPRWTRMRAGWRWSARSTTCAAAGASLTPREREVLGHVASGRMNKQIAGEMGIAEITAKIHRGQAMRKMRSRSVAELVRKMQAIGVIREAA